MKQLLFSILFITAFLCYSQSEWVEQREPFPYSESEADYALSYLHYGVHYDYKYDEEGQFICDVTYHAISRPNNDDGLESVNRIYISLRNVIDVLDIKSRTITKDGKITVLDQNNIKEIEDEESEAGFRIFAVEGAEIGGEIEYQYTKRVYGSTFISEPVQFLFPVKEISFALTAPENLEFEFNIANDTNLVVQVDTADTFNQYQVLLKDVPGYISEGFSGFDANKKRLDFRLAYNSAVGKKRINTYADAGKRIYNNAHELTKDGIKLLEDFIKENDLDKTNSIQRLKHLEHEVKKRFYLDIGAPDDVPFLFENGFAGRSAFLKTFVFIVEYLNLNYEIVATTDRFDAKFDPQFSTWNYLDDYLLFFPDENQYLSVHQYTERYGSVPSSNTATLGLFIRPESITDFIYPISRIDYIPEVSYIENMNNLDVNVSLDDDLSKAMIKAKRIYTGTEANYYKTTEFWMDKEQQDELLNELAEYLATDGQVISVEVEEANNSAEEWRKPFILKCVYENRNFIEYAGDAILFKIGELIGLQSELYEDEERTYEVENRNNRGYLRNISFVIPDGYEIQNIDDVVLSEKVYSGEKPVFVFESSYELDRNKLNIQISEFYDQIFFPKERFEEFRTVINAAADWNKVTLVLKEK